MTESLAPVHFRNEILARLPAEELAVLTPRFTFVELQRRDLLYDAGKPMECVHFIEAGIASVLSVMADGSGVETATIGAEGMVAMAAFHGVERTAEQGMMQVPGSANRMSYADFREVLPRLPELNRILHRYSVYIFTFAAQNSGCNRKHSVEQRLARWLLIVHDRVQTPELGLTHDFISQMLGVRRASVTDALAVFEQNGLTHARRAAIEIRDRAGLEQIACECYGVIRDALEAFLGNTGGTTAFADKELSRDGRSTLGDGG